MLFGELCVFLSLQNLTLFFLYSLSLLPLQDLFRQIGRVRDEIYRLSRAQVVVDREISASKRIRASCETRWNLGLLVARTNTLSVFANNRTKSQMNVENPLTRRSFGQHNLYPSVHQRIYIVANIHRKRIKIHIHTLVHTQYHQIPQKPILEK